MHKAVLVIVAVVAPIFCECLMQEALADSSATEARELMKESLSGWKDDMMTLLFAKPH